ncbi:DUF2637 domain-containing protein [Micromonospora carbonacea]|uniref:DUF2637 domain-containing protein n=1 Tax=Micromonospora carbonacea TaxID=47853 RepID=UPI0033EC6352
MIRLESAVRVVILLVIGGMAGAAAFTHVHDLSVAHGQPHWIGWANAVAVELMAIYLGLELRARRRAGRPVGLVAVLLVAFALLSLAAQVAEAEPSVWGWIVAAVPSLAFLALVKVVLSSAPATPEPEPVKQSLTEPEPDDVDQVDSEPVETPAEPLPAPAPVPAPIPVAEPVAPVVLPPRVVHPSRPAVVGIVR